MGISRAHWDTFQILKATITVTVSGTQTFAGTPGYSFGQSPVATAVGGALAGCAPDATGSSPVGSSYHVLVATCTGLTTDANHQIAYADGGLTVTKANSSTVVNCPSSVIFSGTAQTPCSASITGAGGLSLSPAPGYANNTGPGVATASYTYGGDGNHYGSNGSANFLIQYSSGPCLGSPGRQILQPINADGSSVFKQGSTVPAKFRVCDSAGNSVGTSGLVTSFVLWKTNSGTGDVTVNEAVVSTTPDTAFRWDPTDKQWIFNIDTKGMSKNKTYTYVITLNDTTTIQFSFGLK